MPTEYGNRDTALNNEILRSVVGSGVHGIAIQGTDDHDEMGIYVDEPESLLGLTPPGYRADYIWRSQPEGARSGPGDTDLVMYSLRKYLRLAVKGNPTALIPLFAPEESLINNGPLGQELRDNKGWFLSVGAVHRFLGYMESQHTRMLGGGKRNRVPNRPELVKEFGWDVKYGAHALRLAYQGFEMARRHTLTLPLPSDQREHVLSVKKGLVPREEVSQEIYNLSGMTRTLLRNGLTFLPEEPNYAAISDWSIKAHQRMWGNYSPLVEALQ